MKFKNAKEISAKTRQKVLERQKGLSISGTWLRPNQTEFHHYVERGQSGVGYEWNIVALTSQEHRELHDGCKITVNGRPYYTAEQFETLIRNHLCIRYANWSREKCKYIKGNEEKDYGVKYVGNQIR